jgi:hypothetical protein
VNLIDFEQAKVYEVIVSATDQGSIPLSSTCKVIVFVSDANDNAPIFAPLNYTVGINEKMAIGSFVSAMQVTDADSGLNSKLSFTLSAIVPVTNSKFVIDASTGLITTNQTFNIAGGDLSIYTILVTAFDGGSPQKSASVELSIVIGKVTTSTPLFNLTVYRANVTEDAAINTTIATTLAYAVCPCRSFLYCSFYTS